MMIWAGWKSPPKFNLPIKISIPLRTVTLRLATELWFKLEFLQISVPINYIDNNIVHQIFS